jgi:hypothetical protein
MLRTPSTISSESGRTCGVSGSVGAGARRHARGHSFRGVAGSLFRRGPGKLFDHRRRSTIRNPTPNALTVATWICPLVLDNANTTGTKGQSVHFVEKATGPSTDVEWALRPYNQTNPMRHSRLSFYTFNLGSPAGEGNGSYMEYGVSPMTRRLSSLANGFSSRVRPSRGFRRPTRLRVASCGSRPPRRSGSPPTNVSSIRCISSTARVQ